MAESELLPFDASRRSARVAGFLLSFVAAAGLVAVSLVGVASGLDCETVPGDPLEAGAPSPTEQEPRLKCDPAGGGLDPAAAAAATSVLGAVLGVGTVSLAYDYAVRRKYGHDLLHFLGIQKAMVKTGLSGVSTARRLDLSPRFDSFDELVYLGRSPNSWLSANVSRLLEAAESRRIAITIALPNPGDAAAMNAVAIGLGIPRDQLATAISAFVAFIDEEWKAAEPSLATGTTLRVVYTDDPPLFDAIHATGLDAVCVSKPLNAEAGDELLAFTFEKGDPNFPAGWIAKSLEPLADLNEIIGRRKD